MSFLNKLGIGIGVGSETSRDISRPAVSGGRARTPGGTAATAGAGPARAPDPRESTRVSNGLKEFLWNLDGLGRGTLLDLGPAWQTTLSFFIERGFRVSSEDILRAWKDFLVEEEGKLREATGRAAQHNLDVTPAAGRRRFRYVSQQEARGLPTLSGRRSQHAAGDLLAGFVSRAACLSKPRDSRPLQSLPNREVICRSRPTS